MQQKLLKLYGLDADIKPIGEGYEALVFALDTERVLKIYKRQGPKLASWLQQLQSFYAALDTSKVQFAVPQIYNIATHEGVACSIDKRLAGTELDKVMNSLHIDAKRTALLEYVEAAKMICSLSPPYAYFGEVLAENPIRDATWSGFLSVRIHASYEWGKMTIGRDVPGIEDVLDYMDMQSARFHEVKSARLVHGDYFVKNVLMDGTSVSAVLDFNTMTLAGDPFMDVASAVIFLSDSPVTKRDGERTYLVGSLEERYGPAVRDKIHFYRLYYALLFGSFCKDTDPNTYAWSIASLRQHLDGTYTY